MLLTGDFSAWCFICVLSSNHSAFGESSLQNSGNAKAKKKHQNRTNARGNKTGQRGPHAARRILFRLCEIPHVSDCFYRNGYRVGERGGKTRPFNHAANSCPTCSSRKKRRTQTLLAPGTTSQKRCTTKVPLQTLANACGRSRPQRRIVRSP